MTILTHMKPILNACHHLVDVGAGRGLFGVGEVSIHGPLIRGVGKVTARDIMLPLEEKGTSLVKGHSKNIDSL